MKRYFESLVFVFLILLGISAYADDVSIENFKIYSEDVPPLNFKKDGHVIGLSVDLLMEIFDRLNINKRQADTIMMPWPRAYSEAQRNINTILFTTVRTPARDQLFKWVGPDDIAPPS